MIRGASVKRVLGVLDDLVANHPEKYATFWTEFGRAFKEGVVEDTANRDRIASLLRFASTHDGLPSQATSLADYVGRMKPGQDAIYYITADGFPAAKSSPHLEVFLKQGVEVLLMYDRVDEWVVSSLTQFEGKPLHSVARGDLDLRKLGVEVEKPEQEEQDRAYKDLLARIQGVLGERASAVRLSHRLIDSPACLVADEHGMSTHLERLLKSSGQTVPASKPVLEINPDHPVVERLKQESDDALFADWSQTLFDQAVLAEGGDLEDSAAFVKRLNKLMLALAGGPPSRIWTPGG